MTRSGPTLAPRSDSEGCAGQGCTDRLECQRYLRVPGINQRWASFDIERAHFGTCEAQLPIKFFGRKASDVGIH